MIVHKSNFDFRSRECTKIRSKIASKMAWLKFTAKTLQDASKTLTRRPKKLSDLPQDAPQTPKTPQDAPRPPQDAPKPPKTTPRQRFWDDFKESLEDFWKIFLEEFTV